jgi:hypothetical protein
LEFAPFHTEKYINFSIFKHLIDEVIIEIAGFPDYRGYCPAHASCAGIARRLYVVRGEKG